MSDESERDSNDDLKAQIAAAGAEADLAIAEIFADPKLPDVLYHYTAIETAQKIVDSRELWATNPHYVNDSKEMQFAVDIFESVAANVGFAPSYMVKGMTRGLPNILYITSFSEDGDSLSQWRGYCPDGGVSLGFAPTAESHSLHRVYYDEPALREPARKICDAFSGVQQEAKRLATEEARAEVDRELATRVLKLAVQFKHPAFRDEAEWRKVILLNPREIDFQTSVRLRAGPPGLVPYHPWSYEKELSLAELVIGPGLDAQRLEYPLRHLLPTDAKISRSSIPYRAW